MNYKKIHDQIIDRARNRLYDQKIHQLHHVVPRHEDSNSTEVVPLTFKEHVVVHRLRHKMTGTLGNFLAWKMMKGLKSNDLDGDNMKFLQSEGGKVGGATTRKNNKGIFSPDYDRSAQSKKNWIDGLMDHVDFSEAGRVGGSIVRDKRLGFLDEKYSHLKTQWAKEAAKALEISGNRSGICGKDWREQNPDKVFENNRKGGLKGGPKTGRMFWWNDGTTNTKAFVCPGENFVRGMLMSEKKRAQFERTKQQQTEQRLQNRSNDNE